MSSRSARTIGAAGVLALALLVAQVALAEGPISRFTPADQAAARATVIALADFGGGAGWKGGLKRNVKAFAGDDCPGLWAPKQSDLVVTGVARSEFNTDGAQVASGAQVYKTARMAELDWNRTIVHPAALTCMRRQAVADQTATVRLVSMKRIPFPRIGERAAIRIRVIVDYTIAGESKPLRVVTDDIAFGHGRTGVVIEFAAPYTSRAFADAAEARLARILYSRIRA